MIVNPNTFDSTITPEQVYQLINTLPVGYMGLSQQMHYWGRLFGVVTGEQNEQDWDNFVVNQCLRDSVWSTLRAIVDETESSLGYNLSRRFHHETIHSTQFGENLKVMPGIESVNREPTYSTVVGLETVSVSPFVLTGLTATLESSKYYVLLPDNVVDNPHKVHIRRSTDMGTYAPDPTRRPSKVGSNWKVYLDNQPTPYQGTDPISVQHTDYVYVDITPPSSLSGTLVPVYTGTTQQIPQAKPMEILSGGQHRYWFYIYTLVDPAFYNNPVNLVNAEYYKLVPVITFKDYTEEEVFGELITICNCCSDCGDTYRHYQVSANIVNARQGVVSLVVEGELFDDDDDGIYERLDTSCGDCWLQLLCDSCAYELQFPYITNPIYLHEKLQIGMSSVIRAVIARTAAELPMVDCGCWIDDKEKLGFIARQQETFSKMSTNVFGTTSVIYQYGDLRGQKLYAEIMSKVPRSKFIYL